MILPKSHTTVTPILKVIVFILFILFPIVGFWFGIKYQQNTIQEPIKIPIKENESETSESELDDYVLLKPITYESILADPVTGLKTITYNNFRLKSPHDEIQFQYPSDWHAREYQWGLGLWPGSGETHEQAIWMSIDATHAPTLNQEMARIKESYSSRGATIVFENKLIERNKSTYVYKVEVTEPEKYFTPNSGPPAYKTAIIYLGQTTVGLSIHTPEYETIFDNLVDSVQISNGPPINRFVTLDYSTCTTNVEKFVSPYGTTTIKFLAEIERPGSNDCDLEIVYTPHNKQKPRESIKCTLPTSWQDKVYHVTEESVSFAELKEYDFLCSFHK